MADNKPSLLRRLEHVDRRAVTAVEEAVRGFHRTISDHLRQSSDEMLRLVEGLTPELPRSFFTSQDLSEASAEADQVAEGKTIDQLLEAANRIDSETTQGGILTALLDEARRFASRTAFFLTREGEALGWADRGFGRDGALEGVRLRLDDIAFWPGLSGGAATLGKEACAAFCRQLGVAAARRGVMVPFVLRGQIGGALYADRPDDEKPLGVASLQLLTHLAAQALETASLRGDGGSPALRRPPAAESEDEAEPPAPAVEEKKSDAAAVATAAAAVGGAAALGAVAAREPEEPRVAEEPAEEAAEPSVEPEEPGVEPEAAEPSVEPEEPVAFEPAEEVVAEPIDESELEALAKEPDAIEPGGVGFEMVSPDAESAQPEPAESTFGEPSAVIDIPQESVSEPELEDTGDIWALQEDDEEPSVEDEDEPTEVWPVEPEPAAEEAGSSAPEAETDVGQQTVRLDVAGIQGAESGAAAESRDAGEVTTELPRWDVESAPQPAPEFELEADVSEPATEAVAMPPADDEATAIDEEPTVIGSREDLGASAATAEPEPPAASPMSGGYVPPAPEEPAAAAPAETSDAETGGSTQVLPPTDLQGPGLAFTGSSAEADAEDALREEARRLARLLVSEIKLYNEEIIEKGRRAGNIYERLKDDIDRSRQMYEERIDPRILKGDEDFFRQELVQRLAGGNEDLLGDA